MKKEILCCDECEEEIDNVDVLFKCLYCNEEKGKEKLYCKDCADEHAEEAHCDEIVNDFFDQIFDKVEE